MTASVVLLNVAGAVALLLFATNMVRNAVKQAYGDVLRNRLRILLRSAPIAIAAGLSLAVALQSATAVALIVGSLSGSGIVAGASGLLAVLGADVGSALVVWLLSFDLTLLAPIFLVVGTVLFMSSGKSGSRDLGRILVGIGLLILSLRLIGEASQPLQGSRIAPMVVNYFAGDPLAAFGLAAIVTWMFHSSVAAVLLVVALAARGLVPVELGLVLVLGANFGGGVIAVALSRTMEPPARVIPLANLIVRGTGAVVALATIVTFAPPLELLGATVAAQLVHWHVAFNLILLMVGVPLAGPSHRLAERLIMLGQTATSPSLNAAEFSALDEQALASPSQALANAAREVMRVCETIEIMLSNTIELYEAPDQQKIDALSALDDEVDRRHATIKLYLAKVTQNQLSQDEALRAQELLGACVKLEQVGDIVVRNMLVHVQKKLDRGVEFTEAGWQELSAFHATVLANARLAFNVLVSRDPEIARQLVEEKDRLRDLEKESSRSHFERLGDGAERSVETSSIHLDTIRDLKQVNSLLASMAYPILEKHGLLRGSRLNAGST